MLDYTQEEAKEVGYPKIIDAGEREKDTNKIEHGRVAITGSVHFPKYGEEGNPDTVRGEQSLRAIEKVLDSGFGVIVVITKNTNAGYREKLNELKNTERLILIDEEEIPVNEKGEKDEDAHSYGVSRRQAIKESKKRGFAYVMTGELEKEDLLDPKNLDLFIKSFEDKGVGMAIMNRKGVMEKSRDLIENNTIGLPDAQYYGEYSQNLYIWRNWKGAGFNAPEVPYDLLNGTRFTVNEKVRVKVDGYDYLIKPSDLMEVRYHYQNESEIGFPYKVDHYSAAIYHSPTLWMALAGKDGIASVEIDYQHPEEQTRLEEGAGNRETFITKRLEQKRAIVLQNFDLCCNIVLWKENGMWPEVIMEAINNKKPLELKHFDIKDWKLENGKIVKRREELGV